ncbi:protein transport protein Sec16A-like isoform X4 [Ostrea edulis]|uniref:protein transport protein Sec16A-like isoform X4 n=1 Tax=Ostrea edulis TaxID=37623 RepID=UPI0024AE9A34|nr:protein transport protein Sec16A-like isoform X4 [Ostrea edulis]
MSMNQSAPWSFQQQNTDPGGVKLFNPAQFTEQANQPNKFNPTQQDGNCVQEAEVFNGQQQNYTGQDPSWNWNSTQSDPSQMAPNPNVYGQVYDPSQFQAVGQDNGYDKFYYDHNQGQWVPQYDQTQNHDLSQAHYDPSQAHYDPSQTHYDPSQTHYDPSQTHYQNAMPQGQQFNESNTEAAGGNFLPNFNQYDGNYSDHGSNEHAVTNFQTVSDGQHHEQVADQSFNSEILHQSSASQGMSEILHQSSASQGMSGYFQNDDYETESNTGTYDSSSLQNSLNQVQMGKPADDLLKPEISSESLQTVNYSAGSLDMAANSMSTPSVQQVTDEFKQIYVSEQGQCGDSKESETNIQCVSTGDDMNQSAMHGQVNSTGNVLENVSGGSPHSDDQQGLSDWEVVPPESSQMLGVPGGESKHSREGSLDNSVQFFIGSSKNSDDGSARHTPESAPQGQKSSNVEKEKENVIDNVTTEHLRPQLTSSPNVSPGQVNTNEGVAEKNPPPAGPPPIGAPSGGNNPFRKERTNTSQGSDIDRLCISQPFSSLNNPQLPSPIVATSDDSGKVAQKTQPQSPIMPRKESPFQPPNRRRTLSSQSSESEDQPKSEKEIKESSPSILSQVSSSRESLASTSSKQGQESEKFKRPPRDTTKSRPPVGSTRGVMSPRRIESAFQQVQKQRAKHNMSPATTLWANNDTLPVANILLAPAAPAITPSTSATSSAKTSPLKTVKDNRDVLSPVQMLINSMSEKQSDKSSVDSKQENRQYDDRQERSHQRGSPRDRHERGSSIDRELEITRKMEEKERKRESESYRDRDRDNYRGSDRARGKDPRERDYDPYYDKQPPQRRRDPYYGDERYERPRSRHSLLDDERSSSRQGQEYDRPRSRQEYNRDADRPRSRQDYGRDAYYRDKYGRVIEELPEYQEGYEQYDYYGRHGYYDRHAYDKYYKYDQRYYDDYYGRGNYEDSFNRLLQFDYQSHGHGQWHHGYPSQYYNQYGQPYEENDKFLSQRGSRVQTPGSLSDTGEHQDYDAYRHYQGSRSSSRQGYDDYTRAWDAYYANYNRGYGSNQGYVQEAAPSRMTPVKHSIPHVCVRFGPGGQLVKVIPNRPAEGQPATVEIHDINEMLQDNPETEELKNFPGPLVRGDTHKNDVLTYCQSKAKACAENVRLTDRDSAELIWRLLEVLIKQNGTYVGTDIADLLLEGHEPTTIDYSMMGLKINPSSDTLDEDLDESADVSVVTADRSVISRGGRKTREEVTDRFRHLLLYGRKKDALECAMKNNLWGHALFLASKMDSRAHANVMTRFANSAMKMNDPLQTLFQLMSCRQPAAVTCVVDEKWGDWRPHLAMILSNPTGRDIDRKSIMTLGDTLASKGFLHASHFCYIMAQVNFGSYQKKTAKMVLVGSNHSLPLTEFSTNEAIQCTEIYEYANTLGNPSYYTVNFQSFKFLYACRLAENGFAQEALQYCEAISRVILNSPTLFQPILVKLVNELGNRLKYFDPQKLHTTEDEDPFWLQQLSKVNAGFLDGSIQPLSGSVTPYGGSYGMRAASTESGEVAGYIAGGETAMMPPPQVPYGQDFNQPQQSYSTPDPSAAQQTEHVQQPAPSMYSQYGQPPEHQQQTPVTYGQYDPPQEHHQQPGSDNQTHQGYTQNPQVYTQGMDPNAGVDPNTPWQQFPQNGYQQYGVNQQFVNQQTTEGNENTQNYNDPNSQGQHPDIHPGHHQAAAPQYKRNSIYSANTVTTEEEEDDDDDEEDDSMAGSHNVPAGSSSFDYFSAVGNQSQEIVAPRMRPRTVSETSTGSGGPPPHTASANKKPHAIPESKLLGDKKPKEGWSWWPFKGKKEKKPGDVSEMKLPDDKKPSIIWDEDKKEWINKDEGERKYEPPPPPPKDMSLGPTMQQQPAATQAPPGGGPPMGNKFSLRKGKGSMPKYVDVLNSSKSSSAASVPTSLFNVMPSSQSSPAIFSPGGESESPSTQQEALSTGQTVNPPATQVEQVQAGELSRNSSQGSFSSEVQHFMSKGPKPAGMPVMFNPAQFQGGQNEGFQSGPTSTRSSGRLKPGQRRMYPK